jgi:hypothetical protein
MANILQHDIYIADINTPLTLLFCAYSVNKRGHLFMFGCLPEAIKQQVLHHLENDNFRAAKELYDSWLDNNYTNKDQNQ